jgi:thioredoxin-related protein
MKTILLAAITLFATFSVLSVFAQNADKLKPGDELPSFNQSMKNANGSGTTLKGAAKENGLLVMFSCNTCPFVIRNQAATKKIMEYAAAHHIGMIIINSNEGQRTDADSYAAMAKYARAQHYTVPYVIDENSYLADQFGASHTPEVYLFNSQNKLVYKGAIVDNPSEPKIMYAENAINSMVAGKEADPKVTKSVGCSIKRKA